MSMQTILLSLSSIPYVEMTDESCVYGAPNPFLLEEHGLTVNYPPFGFIDEFMPEMNRKKNFREKTMYSFSVETMFVWSNEKAGLMGMGGCKFYPIFQNVYVNEFEKHIYLYYFNGSNSSPRVQMKFISTDQNPFQGSTFIYRVFGTAASLCHKQWKCCFETQDPLLKPPLRIIDPNFKTDPLL